MLNNKNIVFNILKTGISRFIKYEIDIQVNLIIPLNHSLLNSLKK